MSAVPEHDNAPPPLHGYDEHDNQALVEWFRGVVRRMGSVRATGVLHPEVRFERGIVRHAASIFQERYDPSGRQRP